MNKFGELSLRIKSLTIFKEITEDIVIKSFLEMIDDIENKSLSKKIEDYRDFVSLLYNNNKNENFSEYVMNLLICSKNIYIYKVATKEHISTLLENCLIHELKTLEDISKVSSSDVKDAIKCDIFLPEWETTQDYNFVEIYKDRINNIFTIGYGIYSNNTMFTYDNGDIVPVKHPDNIRLSSHIGYERERKQIIDNTLALLNNKPAANTLLYGEAGTGKSSTIKAIVNEYSSKGLRMIQVRRGDLIYIPDLIENLGVNPLKFIIFIDDLSFENNTEEIGALKTILEGSVSAKTSNVVIYATSNRRHLVKETVSDREGDDLHRRETMEEQISLSDRFGLSIYFGKPGKNDYLKIVHGLAKEYGLKEIENIDMLAERHAMIRGGRSGRIARQFIESLKSME